MKQFHGFVIKELYHIFRDSRTLLILFGMPLVQLILFGFAIRNEISETSIAVLDNARDHRSRELSQKLVSSGYFSISRELRDPSEIDAVFKRNEARLVVVFDPHFAARLEGEGRAAVQLISDASDPNTANMLIAYTTSILRDYQNALNGPAQRAALIVPEVRMLYNPELHSVYMFVPGLIAVVLMLVSALMTSISITREKELGTMEILLVSPLKPFQIILGKVLPYLFLAFVIAVSILLLARYIFQVPFQGSIALFLAECLLFIITALALGLYISTRARSQQVAMMVSLAGLLMPTILLSGFIFPIENMPLPLQLVSNAIPARWFLSIVKGIMLQGLGLEYLWRETLILTAMAVVFIALSLKNFKLRLA